MLTVLQISGLEPGNIHFDKLHLRSAKDLAPTPSNRLTKSKRNNIKARVCP
jgi:hypothetical protein